MMRTIAPSATVEPLAGSDSKPRVDGKFLKVGGKRYWIKGITYGSFKPNDASEPFPPFAQLKDDFARMREAGINTVRLYNSPSLRIADAAHDQGLMLIPEVAWGPRFCELGTARESFIYQYAEDRARELAGHPAVLMYSIGNEIPPLVARWHGVMRINAFLEKLCEIVKEYSEGGLVTYVNHPPTEYLNFSNLDVVSYNLYLERETDFRNYLARLHSLAGERPVFLAELGLDSTRHGREAQAEFIRRFLRASFEKGLCGAAVYSWTDEWSIFDEAIEGWSFGVTDAAREPKPALRELSQIYLQDHYSLGGRRWPRVTVVVATFNGGGTLAACLRSLARLNYPNHEVLVVDDGSTDSSIGEIAAEFGVRYHRISVNAGLSNARNTGMRLADGEIIAYIDDDAFADADWLYFMVLSILEHGASAAGGPNLSPADEKFIAQCVHHSPGNPTHVLLGDELAEHVPGCNMAYVKADLEAIGGFDVTHRAAGDDVDVCWKLLVREKKIAFSPAAFVWHRRRSSVRAYLKQQRGYGYAEAHLHSAYPSRFNVMGHSVWKGSIYDNVPGMAASGLPWIFRPRIYQGAFGGAMFQSMYQPRVSSWFMLFKSVEWQLWVVCILLSGVLGVVLDGPVAWLLVPGCTGIGLTLAAAVFSGWEAARLRRSQWPAGRRVLGCLLVAALHLAQPWARFRGRFGGTVRLWRGRREWPVDARLWGNMNQRDQWLRLLWKHLDACGWQCEAAGEWEDCDLIVKGPGFYQIRIISVYEEILHRGWHWVRFRLEARRRRRQWLAMLVVAAGFVAVVLIPALLPLGIPLLAMGWLLARSKRHTLNAISQAAMECGTAIDMPAVAPEYQI